MKEEGKVTWLTFGVIECVGEIKIFWMSWGGGGSE